MIKIILVDDHELVRAGVKSLLAPVKDIKVIGEATNGNESIILVNEKKPDVVLMDLKMKGISGIEATRKILKHHPEIKILALTICDNEIFTGRLLRLGACGYLTKDCQPEELINAIRLVYAGKYYIEPRMAQKMALNHFSSNNKSPFEALSKRELQVTLMIASGQKAIKIAKQLHLSPKTVNTYRYRLFKKLAITNDVELTHLALHYGLIDDADNTLTTVD